MCLASLEILNRTIMVATHPEHGDEQIRDMIHNIGVAARVALGGQPLDDTALRKAQPVDRQKFDMKEDA